MEDDMKEIPLTRGKVTLVDDQDYDFLMQWKWHAHPSPSAHTYYAARSPRGNRHGSLIWMHRLIMGTPKGMETDHKDHDGLHNWRGNLRVCTSFQNHGNRRVNSNNKSGYKGVYWHYNKWVAAIQLHGHITRLGTFLTPEAAAVAYNEAAIVHFGKFARLNKIPQ